MRHTSAVTAIPINLHLHENIHVCDRRSRSNHTLQGLTSEQSIQRLVDGAVVAGLSGVVIGGVDEQLNVSVTVL